MDRLTIESTLANVNEIFLSDAVNEETSVPAILLGFKASNAENVIHVWSVLKEIADKHETELIICKTMVAGMYDLEIKTSGLDEPLRIMNKSIPNETFDAIGELVNAEKRISLGTSVSDMGDRIKIHALILRECTSGN